MATAEVTLTPTVSKRRRKGKQDDLPTMEDHQRKIAEIEEAADRLVELEDQLSAAREKRNDAMDELVASMRRHDKNFYERQTWGKVVLKEPKLKATVTQSKLPTSNQEDDEPVDTADE